MRAFILCLFLFITCILQAQTYPVNQSVGNTPATLVTTNSIRANQGVILGSFADTAAANLLPYLKNYPGAMIYTTGDGSIWVRNPMASGWIDIGGGITPSGSFWKVGGNFFPVAAPTRNIGTLQPYGGAIGLMTNSNVHLILSDTGLFRNQSVDDSVLVKNTLGEFGVYPKSAFSGGSYTFPYSVVAPGDAIQLENDTIPFANGVYTFNSAGRRTWQPISSLVGVNLFNSNGTLTTQHRVVNQLAAEGTLTLNIDTIYIPEFIKGVGWPGYIDMSNGEVIDAFGMSSLRIQDRLLQADDGTLSIDWNNRQLIDRYTSGGITWWDSLRIHPEKGVANIDSLRTWSAVADTTHKKPMTWDTRNGRWEYASNWFGGGSGSPAGSDKQIQYNNGGSFGGAAGVEYGNTNILFRSQSQAATDVAIVAKGHASQSANLFEVQNSSGTAIGYYTAAGRSLATDFFQVIATDIAQGNILGTGYNVLGAGANQGVKFRDNTGAVPYTFEFGFGSGPRSVLTGARLLEYQGTDVASAAGAIALSYGNSFEITGTASITLISNVNWQNGSEVTLWFTSTATLVDGTANSGTDIGMELAGNTNFTASAGASLTLQLIEIGGTQRWREKCRSVNSFELLWVMLALLLSAIFTMTEKYIKHYTNIKNTYL